jgi:integrase/recombinase XerD
MIKYSAPNERIKHEYFIWLKEAEGRNEASIDGVAKAIDRFETYTRFRDFKQFRPEQARRSAVASSIGIIRIITMLASA